MAGKYPPFELDCHVCGHRWHSTAAPGASIKCPECLKRGEIHTRRMPADRPRTASQARAVAAVADDDGLAAAWGAEQPYEPSWRKIPGAESARMCPQCSKPMRWTGAHTGLVCLACPVWTVSPGAETRAAEHLAAIDKSAARKSAQLADPEAERIAADTLEARRAEFLDDLDGLADALDVTGFPRSDPQYERARVAGLQYGAIVARYRDRVRQADKLDQLDRIGDDAEKSLAGIASDGGWLDRIADLRDQLDRGPGKTVRGEVIYDDDQADDDQADDDDQAERYQPGQLAELARQAGVMPGEARERAAITRQAAIAAAWQGTPPADAFTPKAGPWCEWCRRERRYVGDTYPLAVARIEAAGMVPAPVDVCADHLAGARQHYGAGLSVLDQFWAAYDAAATARARAAYARSAYSGRPA